MKYHFVKIFRTYEYVNDYSQIENFVNPYQDYVNTINYQNEHKWFNAELLAAPKFDTMDKEKIEDWLNENIFLRLKNGFQKITIILY